ncbi:hypothetical protein PRZ48_014244 [Zasmidium cellare]|uniref:Uncharacterized protein n=1 Tax=Zasmidium cellare TaxID=395010 RepID=A0ABR0E0Y5_ZASCE|nr:hypothetical protein PRZ48_014244 [Zasmidium cellare]
MVTTRSQAAAAAIASTASAMKVFEIPELFEMILLEVDTKTLLLSQRAHSIFKNTINSSKKLQRALWLLPPVEKDDEDEDEDAEIEVNPFFLIADEDDENPQPHLPFSLWVFSQDSFSVGLKDESVEIKEGSWQNMILLSPGVSKWAFVREKPMLKFTLVHEQHLAVTAGDIVELVKGAPAWNGTKILVLR